MSQSRPYSGPFPDDEAPEGAVVDGEKTARRVDGEFDFVVVGSGAAGAVAAHTLAAAGHSVAMVEEGPWVKTREFASDVYTGFRTMMRDGATQAIEGRSYVPMLQAVCVGGSTVVNSAIAWRVPEDVLADWSETYGLADTIRAGDLEEHYDALEQDLAVRPVTDEALGENNRLFLERGEKNGWDVNRMRRYDRGCVGHGRCLQGCPKAAKQGMNVTYVPWALELGARLYASCRVLHVEMRGGRAVGVVARSRAGHDVRLRAKRGVFVAASTVQTPNLLRRSGLRARDLGRHFMAHPGIALAGVFDKPVHMDVGASQGAESIHFRKTRRFKLETIEMPPELAAARMPGAGRALMKRLADYAHVAVWAVQIRARAEGVIKTGWGGRDKVVYSLGDEDVKIARDALGVLAKMMLDQGAKELWPGVHGLPAVMRDADGLAQIARASTDPRAYSFVATHLFGAARMGPDPRSSVVGLDFQTHEAKGLYVVDSSVFPTNLGVNPQHTIMAIARLAATRAAAAVRTQAA